MCELLVGCPMPACFAVENAIISKATSSYGTVTTLLRLRGEGRLEGAAAGWN